MSNFCLNLSLTGCTYVFTGFIELAKIVKNGSIVFADRSFVKRVITKTFYHHSSSKSRTHTYPTLFLLVCGLKVINLVTCLLIDCFDVLTWKKNLERNYEHHGLFTFDARKRRFSMK